MTFPSNLSTQAATGSTSWVTCAKIKALDGKIVTVTEHDLPLTIDLGDGDGALVYTPADAVEMTSGRVSADLSVDNRDIIGVIDAANLTHEDLHGGRYDEGQIVIFTVDWKDPQAGQWIQVEGPLGKVESGENEFTIELNSWMAYLARPINHVITEQCRKSFGTLTTSQERKPNQPCGVDLNPPTWQASTAYVLTKDGDRTIGSRVKPSVHNGFWFRCIVAGTSAGTEPTWPLVVGGTVVDGGVTWEAENALVFPGTVSTVTNPISFSASGIGVSAGFFSRGFVKWLTGANALKGVRSPIATDDGAGAITLYRPPIEPISIGDTFDITAGCDKSQVACKSFSNFINNNGLLYVPASTVQ